ncbi:biotin-dependent carboxyltransferase family protein [Sphingomonas sp. IC-11]|uniref:5-oxoprolinase subunit C family protein n=1 Tax=Sphingomonas sp. IC-11 TaxID=2898528 RepID=UPI001E443565|nr:biotin-dependent carboxyltransferase family protein [Sphingomonas sp. IC-11]MCD2315521.1 biotin-dependent carboxyltransferase family protein [Sphingomonas sp. IC-11]
MSEARLLIEAAGPLTTVQDAGRPGWRRFGVPPSGPVDRRAFAAAVSASGGHGSVIELSLGGLTFKAEGHPVAVAITGAATAEVNGVDVGGWCVVTLQPGARCRIRESGGNWGYCAPAGRIVADAWLGSSSTHLIAGLGGGRIAPGGVLTVRDAQGDLASVAIPRPPQSAAITVARAILGPQQRFFSGEVLEQLEGERFMASPRFDRMGMILDGPRLPPSRIDMPSEPAIRGALQIDGDGRMSLLTADHQTTGGYPRVAVVIEPDIDRIAQLPVGAGIRFELVDEAEAIAQTRAAARQTAEWLTRVKAGARSRPPLITANLTDGVVVRRLMS